MATASRPRPGVRCASRRRARRRQEPTCVRGVVRGHNPAIDDDRRPRVEGEVHLDAVDVRTLSRVRHVAKVEPCVVAGELSEVCDASPPLLPGSRWPGRTRSPWPNPDPRPTLFDRCGDPCATPGGGPPRPPRCGAGCRSRSANPGRRRDRRRRPRRRRSMLSTDRRPAAGSRPARWTRDGYRPSGRGCRCRGGQRIRCRPPDRCMSEASARRLRPRRARAGPARASPAPGSPGSRPAGRPVRPGRLGGPRSRSGRDAPWAWGGARAAAWHRLRQASAFLSRGAPRKAVVSPGQRALYSSFVIAATPFGGRVRTARPAARRTRSA